MRKNYAPAALVFLAFIAFLLTAGLAETPIPFEAKPDNFLSNLVLRFAGGAKVSLSYLVYALVHMAALGAAVPLYLAKRFDFIPFTPVGTGRFLLGTGLLAAGLFAGIFAVGREPLMDLPHLKWSVKSFLIGAQFGISLTLYAFFIIPQAVGRLVENKNGAEIAAFLASIAAAGLIFLAEHKLGGSTIPPAVLVAAVPFALGTRACGSIYMTAAHSVLLYAVAALPLRQYHIISFRPLHAGFLLMFCIGCMYLSTRSKRTFPPARRTNAEG